jgi:hypothetical protein
MRATSFTLLLLLSACAGPIETRITSSGLTSPQPASFAGDPKAADVAATNAQTIASRILAGKGYSQAEIAELNLQVTVSDRPAELSLQSGTATLSPAAVKKQCAKREYRVGVTLTKIADGAEHYHGTAAEYHCKLALADVLDSMVASALADLGAPRGSYTVKRPR